jgi:hypothetical protein
VVVSVFQFKIESILDQLFQRQIVGHLIVHVFSFQFQTSKLALKLKYPAAELPNLFDLFACERRLAPPEDSGALRAA